MTVRLSSPAGLIEQDLYHHVASASGGRTLYLAGQTGSRADREVVATDLAGQVHGALRNIATALSAEGAGPDALVRLTVYVVDWTEDLVPALEEGVRRAQDGEGFPSPLPPLTVIGVQALYTTKLLVEIEAVAVLDEAAR